MSTPFGALGIRVAEALLSLDFLSSAAHAHAPTTALAREVCAQLRAYLKNPRHVFDLPLDLNGSPHQERVWSALQCIPSGQVRTYGMIARKIGSAARAVGAACRQNPVPVIVPCHRVVAVSGPGGFMGQSEGRAIGLKRWLLEHERS